jgi:hypothetical protein
MAASLRVRRARSISTKICKSHSVCSAIS